MTQPTHRGLTFIVVLIFASVAWAQDENGIWSHEAKNHIGEFAMVCGVIVSIRRERQAPQPEFKGPTTNYPFDLTIDSTILYFDRLPPDHEFVAVIGDVNRKAFPHEPESFVDQKACVYGKILKYKSKTTIAVIRPDQIAVAANGKGGH